MIGGDNKLLRMVLALGKEKKFCPYCTLSCKVRVKDFLTIDISIVKNKKDEKEVLRLTGKSF